ncbi:carbohydrate porin [Gluconacetobacter entanii]|uniref:carbohydrate porin n=1 Tax=Gluconacetobacter entanii TaxID=108528 RepID=UPI001C93516F|nr:carbohydrate porin [Gluconacetobacter entanii]MBY4639900.1 carbohydrate porin [Gluconacetobacter entanii]MCW4579740.1 carbohydrate porin [Gluconacetobacter entanii]MCW4583146.1 carbohydrate porin [Gluconacetobacter entanii]MCW4586536.1 carbohydrate porin [Gluconacetobacter entanii]
MTFFDSPCVTRRSARVLFTNSILVGSLFAYSAAYAQAPQTQIEEDRARLGNSTPLVEQIDPATIRDSERAQADAAEKAAGDDKLDTSGNLLGNMWGARSWMYKHGISFDIQEVDELWGNGTGGSASGNDGAGGSGTGPSYDGVTMPTLTVDTEKLFGLKGGLFNVSALQTRGRSISQDHLANFNPVSGFEADRSTRLFELWYQQSFLGGKLDVKIGQQDLDTEFLISDYASLYLNANFGWPMAPSVNLYGGGPSWPLSSPAIRIRYRPSEKFTFMFAAADDNPPGNRYNSTPIQQATGSISGYNSDPTSQTYDGANGTNFNMGTGALLMTELQYALNPQPADMSNVTKNPGLPGVYKLGGFYDTAKFADYRYNRNGGSLGAAVANATAATPQSDLTPRWDRGNWMVYGIIDQMIWRPSLTSARSVGVFVRATGNGGDRNQISFAIDAGLNLKAPFKGRDNDTIGLGWGIGRASSGLRQFDRDSQTLVQGNENHLELTYQAQVTPWMVMQPDFQYVWHPSGGAPDWTGLRRVGDEAIFGLHSSITF